ncbi:MAG: hypothetical protein FWB95_08220 [Treponema sp.]|nr:hypothetical protein [Treponema sp.]
MSRDDFCGLFEKAVRFRGSVLVTSCMASLCTSFFSLNNYESLSLFGAGNLQRTRMGEASGS